MEKIPDKNFYLIVLHMKNEIIKKLDEIENKHKVKILYACEAGSRVWGFHSNDSDYDVRFIYIHKNTNKYLELFDIRDVIEIPTDGILDINGWDLKKALKLMYKSNPPLYEWLFSPTVYQKNESFYNELLKISNSYYKNKAAVWHYLNMAERNYNQYIREKEFVKLKKYLYVLRPLMCCDYIIKYKKKPPINFFELLDNDMWNGHPIILDIKNLLELKKNGNELGEGLAINTLNEYIENRINEISINPLILDPPGNKLSNDLNKFFIKIWYKISIDPSN